MSHLKERKEKACLNCGAAIYGRYCHICGQENIETKETFWHLITHFIYDITHFDGKFFSTLKSLLLRPGLLTIEYIRGRRTSYLHPIKMYVFTSAIFFITFFLLFQTEDIFEENIIKNGIVNIPVLKNNLLAEKNMLEKTLTSQLLNTKQKNKLTEKLILIKNDLDSLARDTSNVEKRLNYFKRSKAFSIDLGSYQTVNEYATAQSKLPANKRDGFIFGTISKKAASLNEKYKDKALQKLLDSFLHKLPQMLFVSLPIFALALYFLYFRQKKYYVEHGIFSVHIYCKHYINVSHYPYKQFFT